MDTDQLPPLAARPARTPLGAPLAIWLAMVTLANGWNAVREGAAIRDSILHGTFFRPGGGIEWSDPTTIALVSLAAATALALVGNLLLWLRVLAGLWLFLLAQIATLAMLIHYGAFSPLMLLGVLSAAILAWLAQSRRTAFR